MTQPPGQQPGWWRPPPDRQPPPWQPPPPSPQAPRFDGRTYGGLGVYDQPPPKPKRSRKPWLVGGLAVLVLAGAAVAAWLLGVFRGPVLDEKSVQDGMVAVLRNSYGEQDLRDAQCPANQPIKTGTTFDCTVTVAGQPKTVPIRVLNDKPEFEVGAPR